MNEIQRISKAKLLSIKKLKQKKYRDEEGKFLVEGEHVTEEALLSNWQVDALLVTESFLKKDLSNRFILSARQRKSELYLITEQELDKITDAVTAQGVAAIISKKEYQLDNVLPKRKDSIVVVLDQVNDPGNLGTIVRTCDWFGVDALMVSKNSVELFSPKVIRSTMGSLFHFPIVTDVDLTELIRLLKKNGYTIFMALVDAPKYLKEVTFPNKSALVFGNESHGISSEFMNYADNKVSIKKYGKAESLNVAMACGIFLSHIRK